MSDVKDFVGFAAHWQMWQLGKLSAPMYFEYRLTEEEANRLTRLLEISLHRKKALERFQRGRNELTHQHMDSQITKPTMKTK